MSEFVLESKPDAGMAICRMEAWWEGAILDRPAVQVRAPKPRQVTAPESRHASLRERWMDAEYAVRCAEAWVASTYWCGETLPTFVPNLGPELLAAAYGAELEFGEDTSWSVPVLRDWDGLDRLSFNQFNPYIQKILEMTRLGLDVGRGKFLVGITDLHPGADLAASLRDPQQLCVDLVEAPEHVHQLMDRIRPAFYEMYGLQETILKEAGQEIAVSWHPLFARGRYYIPSADFSCMVSERMFRDFFLQEIVEEVEWLDRSVYHLDGPGALHLLDAILEIPKLDALEFVYGAGNGPASKWMDVYRRVLAAGKNIHISAEPDDLDPFFEALDPEGVMLCTWANDVEHADAIVRRVSKWSRRGR
ncbi:MAG: trimethylamine corrinoid protein 2 [Fimbriimonadia bacterium]|jgi:hypothetical protein